MTRKNNRQIGADYEQRAADYLERLGLTVIERNYRCRLGEIDLILRDGDFLVFAEVKYRSSRRVGDPAEAVGSAKQRRLRNAAAVYLYEHHDPEETPCRFDVIAVCGSEIRWIQNAF